MSDGWHTEFGFHWGPMAVSRLVHVEGRGYVLSIETEHQTMQVYVSEKGRKIKAYPVKPAPRSVA